MRPSPRHVLTYAHGEVRSTGCAVRILAGGVVTTRPLASPHVHRRRCARLGTSTQDTPQIAVLVGGIVAAAPWADTCERADGGLKSGHEDTLAHKRATLRVRLGSAPMPHAVTCGFETTSRKEVGESLGPSNLSEWTGHSLPPCTLIPHSVVRNPLFLLADSGGVR